MEPMSEGNKRILVVDDDELLREFYRRVLSAQGYVPVCAANGAEAMDILEHEGDTLALAVVDLLLPIRTGWELIDFVRSTPRLQRLPLIAITGLSFTFDEFEKVKKSCDAVFLKGDFEIAKFNDAVGELVQGRAPAAPPAGGSQP